MGLESRIFRCERNVKGMSYNRKMIGYSRIKGKLWRIKSHGRLRKGATKRKNVKTH